MNAPGFQLKNAPIVEAVLDIDCDVPPGFDLKSLEEKSRNAFREEYPKFRPVLLQQATIENKEGETPEVSVKSSIGSFQFQKEDEKQLVQLRPQGFSFNRLAPYTSFDDYLPEIEKAWNLYLDVVTPVQIRAVRLRYINKLLLPLKDGNVELNDYLQVAPHLTDEENQSFLSFLNQHAAVDKTTGNHINTVLSSQIVENGFLPVIFDNCVTCYRTAKVDDWTYILETVKSLRDLKNRIFTNTLTDKCLNLYQH